ncbi:MAG: dihydroxyacetone kinase subunit DhaL [Hyphomicrobiales bacterium]|nr:dihydroxyacetone kinase subunit DhaL [Hyphomicrobiales bacterium]
MIDSARLKTVFRTIASAMDTHRDRLCALDGVIGDADHGIAMTLGYSAARDAVDALDDTCDPTALLNTAAKSFLNAVGASSGPLYATAFMRAAACVKGKPVVEDADFVAMLQAMAQGMVDRGKAAVGEKTMIDAWLPASNAARTSWDETANLCESLSAAVRAANAGMEATASMVATKGRSARLGERSLGHVDPGAASAVVAIEAMREALCC